MFALSGTGIGRRVAIGKAMVLDRGYQEIPKYEVSKDQVQSEIERFQSALARTRTELRRIQEEIPEWEEIYYIDGETLQTMAQVGNR